MKSTVILLILSIGCSSGPPSSQKANSKPFTWGSFPVASIDGKNSYTVIGLSGGEGAFGLNIECLTKGSDTEKLKAYVWVDPEPDRDTDVKVKWDDSPTAIEHWGVSGKALTPPRTANFLKRLTISNQLILEYLPFREAKHRAIVLPVTGAAEQLHQYCQVWK